MARTSDGALSSKHFRGCQRDALAWLLYRSSASLFLEFVQLWQNTAEFDPPSLISDLSSVIAVSYYMSYPVVEP